MANMTRNFTSASDMVRSSVSGSIKGALVGAALQITLQTVIYFVDDNNSTGNFKRTMRYYVEDCLVPTAKGCLVGGAIGTGLSLASNSICYAAGITKK